ncbi:MAG: DedA family protein [Patescibacteria group bacterium]|nr:DedA family protein [Patescibacteria group bacterium]
MISSILSTVTSFVTHTISTLGYPGVALLMAIESAAIPLPSEIIMPFSGYAVFLGRMNLWGIALAGGIGSSVGSAILYWIGLKGGRPFIQKYGKYILFSHHDLKMADKFFAKYGVFSTFVGRLLPVVRTYISLPAGISKMPFWKFLWYSFFGSFLWCLPLGYVGMKLGENWETFRNRLHGLDIAIVALIILGIAWWFYRHLKHRKLEAEA